MARNKQTKEYPFHVDSTYGWTDLSPAEMTRRFKSAASVITNIRRTTKFDALAFTGSSGAALAFVVSIATGIPIIYVRKRAEKSHGNPIESNSHGPIGSYLIVDDFISTGDTVRFIYDKIKSEAKRNKELEPQCVGLLLYASSSDGSFELEPGEFVPQYGVSFR